MHLFFSSLSNWTTVFTGRIVWETKTAPKSLVSLLYPCPDLFDVDVVQPGKSLTAPAFVWRRSISVPKGRLSAAYLDRKRFCSRSAHISSPSLPLLKNPIFQAVWQRRSATGMIRCRTTRAKSTGRTYCYRTSTSSTGCRWKVEYWRLRRKANFLFKVFTTNA